MRVIGDAPSNEAGERSRDRGEHYAVDGQLQGHCPYQLLWERMRGGDDAAADAGVSKQKVGSLEGSQKTSASKK